jgi:hypothetical protein
MISDTGPGTFGFAARRQRLLICIASALSLAVTGFVASAAAHPHAQRRSCAGLLAVHDFPGAVSVGPQVNKALHGVYISFCSYGSGPKTAAGGVDQLSTFPSSAAARAAFARNGAAGEKLAKAETHTITEGQFKIKTTVTSDYFSAGLIQGNESAFDILHTTQVTTGPGPGSGSHSSSGTTGFIRVKNQIFAATLQNSLDPEHSTHPSQVRHLLRQVVPEL